MSEQQPLIEGHIADSEDGDYYSYEDKFQGQGKTANTTFGETSPDVTPYTSPRHNQKRTNSCVAQSICKAMEIRNIIRNGPEAHKDLSVRALWYLGREQKGAQSPPS